MDWGSALAEGGYQAIDYLLQSQKTKEDQARALELAAAKKQQNIQDEITKAILVEAAKGLNRKGGPGVTLTSEMIDKLPDAMKPIALTLQKSGMRRAGNSSGGGAARPSLFPTQNTQPTQDDAAKRARLLELAKQKGY